MSQVAGTVADRSDGLTTRQVRERLAADGPNVLPAADRPHPVRELARQLTHLLALLLWRLVERALRVHVETTGHTLTGWDKKETLKPTAFMMMTKFASIIVVKVGPQRQQEFLGRLGLLEPSPIELPESGTPLTPDPWKDISTMTIGFGHGISVTPLQLATAAAGIVNNGIMVPPTILKRTPGETIISQRVVSARTSAEMRVGKFAASNSVV